MKPSDFNIFVVQVYDASATMMELEEWFELYEELLKLIWWNHEIDTPLAIGRRHG